MKKIFLILLMAIVAPPLKAQKLWYNIPNNKLPDGLSKNHFYYKADSTIKFFEQPEFNASKAKLSMHVNTTFYSNMPVSKTQGNDNMPMVRLGDPNTKYTMLVKKIEIVPLNQSPKPTP